MGARVSCSLMTQIARYGSAIRFVIRQLGLFVIRMCTNTPNANLEVVDQQGRHLD